ncbi:MAG TPA: DUF2059 domain-containing protein [Longimicrobiales bacterium]
MRTLVLIPAILLATAVSATAQNYVPTDSHDRAAAELVDLLRLDDQTAASIDVMVESMVRQNPAMAQFRDVFVDFFAEYMKWDELYPQYVRLYREAYTEAELRELIAFYKTPVGRKTVEVMPRLMQEGAQIGQQQIAPHLPELQQRIQARIQSGGVQP